MPRWDEAIEDVLASYERSTLVRGQHYADDGRVTVTRRDVSVVRGRVRGTQPYDVQIGVEEGEPFTSCTCPAYDREGECKHIAALAYVLHGGRPEPASALPSIFRAVYSASSVLTRLPLYGGEPLAGPEPDRWLSLADWFWRTKDRSVLLDHAPAIAQVLERLRIWLPPPPAPMPATGFEVLYAQLAELYADRAVECEIRHALPGPLDDRHPGWTFTYDPKRRVLEARESSSPLLARPLRLALSVALAPGTPLRFEGQAFTSYAGADAWELFALRALLEAMHARRDEAIARLERELSRPLWEHVLDDLTPKTHAEDTREWAFSVQPTYHDYGFVVMAWTRPTAGRATKWKKATFDAAFASERSDLALEREIGRIALCSLEGSRAMLVLGTPQGHELARLLAQHPKVVFAPSRGAIDEGQPVRFVVGQLRVNLERGANGSLAPRLFVGDAPLPLPPTALLGSGPSAVFRGGADVDRESRALLLCSVHVPPPLRSWLETIAKMGGALAFPSEAVPKLATATQPLVSAGVVSLPREALGEELTAEPRAALRIEWRPDGASIEPVVSVHPKAPLVDPGLGARLFTFEIEDKRVFVERRLDDELAIASAVTEQVDAPVDWGPKGGSVSGIEEMIALAGWLDDNPLDLRIEVKRGRTPTLIGLRDARSNLRVNRVGHWLRLDGELDVNGVKLTVGDVLEAVRHARRYVTAGEGTFLELGQETVRKLAPVAMAAELAPANDNAGPGATVHDAFGVLLHEALDVFQDVAQEGVDLRAYVKRFTARTKATRAPPLEKGALRSYQREGVEWMLQLATWAPGCVLADDMGLGKTVQTAAVLKARAKIGPALVVAPASVSSNWVAELARFMPSLDVTWFNEDRAIADVGAGDVVVVSYGLLAREHARLAAIEWATAVVDEAQYVKNTGSRRTDAVRSLTRGFTVALTGTPLENHLGELFTIVDIVFPGLLGDAETFRERFRRPIETRNDAERLEALGRMLAPFLLRRTRASVLRELPPREEITEQLDLSVPERKRYLALRQAIEAEFAKKRSKKKSETAAQLRIALLAALTRLRQLACDPALVDETYDGPSTKTARAVELATEIAAEGNKALVFSSFTQYLDKVRRALEAAGLSVAYLAGDTATTKRKELVDAFQAGAYDVFCVSLLAGGTGLNLTRASYVVHLDPWWNPAAEEQATSRAHRMGQTGPVTVYRLVARGTIEEAVLEMHGVKKALAAAVLDGKGQAKAISEHELLELLRFGG
ncbi:MAG: DEAD/DEAH box helicase [Labilithrix sp.]|nr:DEAD/DEAH box helicase [Labilithrix sp.]MCW5817066.1 DEAD/DEAH box helicase [Labilithrix sp.]